VTSGDAGGTATTLRVAKTGDATRRLLSLGGEPGRWAVTDEAGTVLAEAGMKLVATAMDVDVGGRRLSARMPGAAGFGRPQAFHVDEDAVGQAVITGELLDGGRTASGLVGERWRLSVGNEAPIDFVYRLSEPRTFGFYDQQGAALLELGHDPSFTAEQGDRWWRILFRLWGAAATSTDRYVVTVHRPQPDAALLALIGTWLERSAESRYPNASGGT
jgi:hypothetical protein